MKKDWGDSEAVKKSFGGLWLLTCHWLWSAWSYILRKLLDPWFTALHKTSWLFCWLARTIICFTQYSWTGNWLFNKSLLVSKNCCHVLWNKSSGEGWRKFGDALVAWPLASMGFRSPLVLHCYFRLGSSKTLLWMKSPSPIIRKRLSLHRFDP